MINKKLMKVLFFIYIVLVIRLIIFKYPMNMLREIASTWSRDVVWEGLSKANFQFFRTINLYIHNWHRSGINSFGNLVGNVLAFVPYGYMLPRICRPAKNIFICMFFSFIFILGIELFQLFSAFGIFDVDDILLNMTGAGAGYLLFLLIRTIYRNKEHKSSS